MKRTLSLLILSLFLVACGSPAIDPATITFAPPTGATVTVYQVDAAASGAGYIAHEYFLEQSETILGRKRTTGEAFTRSTTNAIEGYIALDFASDVPTLAGAEFKVDITTLKTNRVERDAEIRQSFLRSNEWPLAYFKATEMTGFPADYVEGQEVAFQLKGDMVIRNVTLPLTFDVNATLAADTLTGAALTNLNMTDLGFDPPKIIAAVEVEDLFSIWVDLVAVAE